MKKMVVTLVLALVLVLSVVVISDTQVNPGRNYKVGFVNLEQAVENYYKWTDLNEKYLNDLQFYQTRIKRMEEDFVQFQSTNPSQEDLQKRYMEIQTRINEMQTALQSEYSKKTDEVIMEVQMIVSNFAQENNYDLVVYEAGTVYASDFVNITDTIIQILKK
jgi:outer membrane protein